MKENINGWFFILNWKMNGSYFEVQDLYGYLTTNMSSKCFIWYSIQYYNLKIWKNNHVSINWSCDRGQHYNLRGKHSMPLPSPIFLRSILSLNSELWPQIYAVLFEEIELRTELSELHEMLVTVWPVLLSLVDTTSLRKCIVSTSRNDTWQMSASSA